MPANFGLFLTVISVAVFLAVVALTIASSLDRRRKARKAALALFVEIEQRGDDLMGVADAVAEPLPDDVCCDLHNRNCEPPSELCCWRCTESQHPWHADGSECALTGWFEPPTTLRERRLPVPARPNALGGWVRVSDERVHRSCEQAYPAGLVCAYCLPILVVHARSVTS